MHTKNTIRERIMVNILTDLPHFCVFKTIFFEHIIEMISNLV